MARTPPSPDGKGRRGPATGFDPKYTEIVYNMGLLGLTDAEIWGVLGVSETTFYRWGQEHPEFREARTRSRQVADGEVAAKLFERATGYSHDAVKIHVSADGRVTKVPFVEHFPPDTQAATWWLKNRHPDKWRDKAEVEHSGTIETATDDQIDARLAEILAKTESPKPSDG